MADAINSVLVALAGSKKAMALFVGLLTTLLSLPLVKLLGLPPEEAGKQAATIASLIAAQVAAYLLGQGVADHGKEAEKAKAPKPPNLTPEA